MTLSSIAAYTTVHHHVHLVLAKCFFRGAPLGELDQRLSVFRESCNDGRIFLGLIVKLGLHAASLSLTLLASLLHGSPHVDLASPRTQSFSHLQLLCLRVLRVVAVIINAAVIPERLKHPQQLL